GEYGSTSFVLENDDYENETLASRLKASKPGRLITLAKTAKTANIDEDDGVVGGNWLDRFVEEVRNAAIDLRSNGIEKPAIGVVVNRVGRARVVFERLRQEMTGI